MPSLYEKIEERERYRRPFNARPYQRQADETIQILINNQNINYIEINGTTIKNEE
jgi:hypothetical protein